MVRVAAYVDGFNLYFGLKAIRGRKYLWLDLQALAVSLLRPGQTLERRCRKCGDRWSVYEEKETDVNIAITLLEDAVLDRYDTALLLSADSDLCPAIRSTKRLHPEKRIVAAFPPRRHSSDLKQVADGYLFIGEDKIRNAQLPANITLANGINLRRHKSWT